MRLTKDWKRILRHAWSVRLLAIAVILTLLEGIMAFADQLIELPLWIHAAVIIASPLVGLSAMFARITFQKEFENEE